MASQVYRFPNSNYDEPFHAYVCILKNIDIHTFHQKLYTITLNLFSFLSVNGPHSHCVISVFKLFM